MVMFFRNSNRCVVDDAGIGALAVVYGVAIVGNGSNCDSLTVITYASINKSAYASRQDSKSAAVDSVFQYVASFGKLVCSFNYMFNLRDSLWVYSLCSRSPKRSQRGKG